MQDTELVNTAKVFTDQGKEKSIFELFVQLYPDVFSNWPGQARKWTYPGDKYEKENIKVQLKKLVRLARKKFNDCRTIIIYDNRIPKDEPGHELLKVVNGRVEINNLPNWTKTA